MDRRGKFAGSAVIALVVRQFSPSRIERQLLTQVFEYVVASQCAGHPVGVAAENPDTQEVLRFADTNSSHQVKRSAA